MKKAVSEARNITIVCAFILGEDKTQFGKLMEDLENSFTQGDEKYPVDLTEAYKLLTNWKQFMQSACRSAPLEAAFMNAGTEKLPDMTFSNIGQVPRAPQLDITTIQCYNCNKMGHYSNECPNPEVAGRTPIEGHRNEIQMLVHGIEEGSDDEPFVFHNNRNARNIGLPREWILQNNQSMVHIFRNDKLLSNIRTVDKQANAH